MQKHGSGRSFSGFFNEQIQRVWLFREALESEAWTKVPGRCQRTKDTLLQLERREDSHREAHKAIAMTAHQDFTLWDLVGCATIRLELRTRSCS